MLGQNDGHIHIRVGQQTEIMIIENTHHLADIACAPQLNSGGKRGHSAGPDAARQGIPADFRFLAGDQAADIGFVDVSADQNFREVGFLKQQFASLHVAALLHRKHVHDAVERSHDVRFVKHVLGGEVRLLRVLLLRGDMLHFGLGVAIFLLLQEEVVVGLRPLLCVLGFLDFSSGSGAFFLQTLECIEVALRRVAGGTGFYDLRLQGEEFFLRSAVLNGLHVRLRALQLRLCVGSLTARLGIVKLQQQLTFLDVVAFLYIETAHRGVRGRVCFKILSRLDFAVGGNDTANGSALYSRGTDGNHLVAHGRERSQENHREGCAQSDDQPAVPAEIAGIILTIQCHEESFTSNNLHPDAIPGIAIDLRMERLDAGWPRQADPSPPFLMCALDHPLQYCACRSSPVTRQSTPPPDWTRNFPKLKPGRTSFRGMKLSSTIRSSPRCVPKPDCRISARSPSATCPGNCASN